MDLIKFKGSDCMEFDYGGIYELLKVSDETEFGGYYETYIRTNQSKIIRIPYSSINTFKENWEVI